ncbi:MAG TPA: hypothetical protein VMJ73_15565 [Rhizomicrobium sp.]|jgi:hypothetical protein|nr:hypothetical protein [Rhizomicrobium sp.]
MKRILTVAVTVLAVCVSSSSFAQYGGRQQVGPIDPEGHASAPSSTSDAPPDPEAQAEDLRLHGQCDKAIPIFRRLAARGGFELAQFNLGLCLIDVGKKESDAQRSASLKAEGAGDVLAAANSGLANAQLKLVTLYLDGVGVASDPLEAGKWALIYHSNGSRFVISLPDISPELQARLDGVLTATSWAEAQARADAWSPVAKDWDAR